MPLSPLPFFGRVPPPRRGGGLAGWPVPQVNDFDEMDVGETVNGWVDFAQWLALDRGEVLTSVASVSATNYKPVGGAAYVTLTGGPQIGTVTQAEGGSGAAGTSVLQQWTGAAVGAARIAITVNTSAGQVLTAWGHQRVGTPN